VYVFRLSFGNELTRPPSPSPNTASQNPQTYHQALLLLAQLGPLVPEQLVHNVMPIFTFMGANVLQRDDAYSLRVVEKVSCWSSVAEGAISDQCAVSQTLESIVPALVKSTKRSSSSRDALVSGSSSTLPLAVFLN
jgi:U3 small nucleolar RNA-associated protein 10